MMLRNLSVLAFIGTPGVAAAAKAAAADPRLSKTRFEVQAGGIAQAAAWLAANRSPDVLIVNDAAEGDLITGLESLAEVVEPTCKVIIVGKRDSIALYRELTARGISDYLGSDRGGKDLVDAVVRLFSSEDTLPKGKLVVVTAASGGAGASTVAAVIADELNRRMGDAILLDLDLYMGTAGLALALEVRDAVADAAASAGLDVAMLERFVVRQRGARVLSTSGTLRTAAVMDSETVERLVTVARCLTKVVVADLPKGWGEAHQRLLSVADEVVLVAAPDLASLRNGRMLLDELQGRRGEGSKPKVVMNKSGIAKSKEYSGADFKEALGSALAAVVPWDPLPLMGAMIDGKPVTEAGGKAVAALRGFAAGVMPTREPTAQKTGTASTATPTFFRGLFAKTA